MNKLTLLVLIIVIVSIMSSETSSGAQSGASKTRSTEKKAFPAHWGQPPLRETRDLVILPGGYGRGSGTRARWIQENLDRDAAAAAAGEGEEALK